MNAADLEDLYQELILDHGRQPRNTGALPTANRHARGFNPLCGDRLTLALQVEDGVVRDVKFEGGGCAISTASASMMTQAVKGRTVAEVEALFEVFHALLTSADPAATEDLGKLMVFAGVRRFPTRVKCATLAWHTLHAALHERHDAVTTEE